MEAVTDAWDLLKSKLTDAYTLELPKTLAILLVGSKGTGKTALAQRFVNVSQDAAFKYIPTTAVHDYWRTSIVNGERTAIHILDSPGTYDVEDASEVIEDHGESQFAMSAESGTVERNPQLEVESVLDAQSGMHHAAIVVVFDVNRRASFEEAKALLHSARQHMVASPCDCATLHLPVLLVANKIDRPKRKRTTAHKEAAALAKSVGAAYVETSALLARNIDEVFLEAARRVMTTAQCAQFEPPESRMDEIQERLREKLKEAAKMLPAWMQGSEEEDEEGDEEEEPEPRPLCVLTQHDDDAGASEEGDEYEMPWPPEAIEGNTKGVRRMCKRLGKLKRRGEDEDLVYRRRRAKEVVMSSRPTHQPPKKFGPGERARSEARLKSPPQHQLAKAASGFFG